MAYNFTIDDSAPMIKYEPAGAWSDKVSADPNLNKYLRSSYHYTTTKGASASLTFVGTGISVIGSRSSFHGGFELRIDDQKIRGLNSFTPSTSGQYRSLLASVRGLTFGTHTVKLVSLATGTGFSSLDLDAFIVETTGTSTTGNNSVVAATTIDDGFISSATSTLTWSNGWAKQSKSAESNAVFLNSTIHETTTKGSSVTLDFVGEGIQIIGAVGPNNTQYDVQLDDGTAVVMNARAAGFTPSSTLYYQTNLAAGPHKVIITNTATDGGALTIDSFQVFGGNGGGNSNVNKTPPIGAIIGAAVAGLVLLCLILGLGFFLWRRKRLNDERDDPDKFSIAQTSYMERVRNINFTFPALPGRRKAKASEGLSRSASRGSEDTIVDPENGGANHTQKKGFGYGIGLGGGPKKWFEGIKQLVVRNPDPSTPPLPVQNQQRDRPVIDIRGHGSNGVSPGMVTVGLDSGVPGPNAGASYGSRGQRQDQGAAQVWVNGNQRIEAGRRFSDQSLDQAWENRGNATGGYGGYNTHKRGQSTPVDRPQVPWTGPRDTDEDFRVSAYQGSRSPSATDYPETPVRPRYEVEQRHSPISSRYAINNGRSQRSDFR
jgi:hypothetical protein